jgi:hypothetical protein
MLRYVGGSKLGIMSYVIVNGRWWTNILHYIYKERSNAGTQVKRVWGVINTNMYFLENKFHQFF